MKARRPQAAPPGQVRIIAGSLRGSRLSVPTLPGLRPTPQRLRQTLFDWLAPVIEGARVLDVFAGSGALGIEALSRGARAATFFERDAAQARAIEADLARLRQAQGRVACCDALQALAQPPPEPFDIVFVDPPFGLDLWARTLALLDANGWLAPAGCVHVEAPPGVALDVPAHWRLHRQREAGAVRAALFRLDPA